MWLAMMGGPPCDSNLGSIRWGLKMGSEGSRLTESERGVTFWLKRHGICTPRFNRKDELILFRGRKTDSAPKFWSPGGRYHRFAIPMSRMTGNQKAAQCYNAFKGMGEAVASDSPSIPSSPPVVAVPGAATPSWHSNRQPRRTRAALAGWNCPARSVNLVCFNAGGYPKPTCGSTCSKSAPGAKYVPNQIR